MEDTITNGPPAPSKMSQDAVMEHAKTGGSTFDPRTGKNLAGSRNIAVGIAPEHSHVHDHPPTAAEHETFTAQVHHITSRHSNSAIGSHHDEETGLHHLEVVGLTPSKMAALHMAQHLGENHAYNLATDEKYSTGNFGQPQPSHMNVDQRFEKLRADSPKRAPYHGTHFSNRKVDKIQGAHRGEQGQKGAASSNADHGRVHAGTKAGHGMDAPAGFYTVRAGHAAPALEAQKPHAYTVRGRFAFGTTDMPEFKNGYQAGHGAAKANGADDKTAHHLGLNNAEHALQDAGYDGYLSPKHPGIVLHFGDHDAEPVQSHQPMEAADVKPQQPKQKLPEGWHAHE
jgi:hypothetical protein